MSDWRQRPRNGKAEFLAHKSFVREGLNAGHTKTYLHQVLKNEHNLTLSLSQFNRHVKALMTADRPSDVVPIEDTYKVQENQDAPLNGQHTHSDQRSSKADASAVKSHKSDADTQRKPLTRADLRKISNDIRNLDLDALVKGKGLVKIE